jgi:hypothetical protein
MTAVDMAAMTAVAATAAATGDLRLCYWFQVLLAAAVLSCAQLV